MALFDLADPLNKPIRFSIPLTFLDEDVMEYPWLADEDRYYLPERNLSQGGYSTTLLGHPCRADGTVIANTKPVVLKIPNLASNRTTADIARRLNYIEKQTITEWALVRKKLLNCKYANPIFDLGSVWISDNGLMQMIVSAQPFLSDAVSLKHWLVKHQWRQKISHDAKGKEIHDWKGLSQWRDWLNVARLVSEALVEIHRRRVTHGDIWPPNIFIADAEPAYAILIDFGESFGVVPTGEPRQQPNHPYRAPERDAAEYVPTQQIDVYSFGKLLLYLAIGRDEEIPRYDQNGSGLLYGHKRRSYVRDLLFRYGSSHSLAGENPELLDIIAQCISLDPVDRPTMIELSDQLQRLSFLRSPETDSASRLTRLASEVSSRSPHIHGIFRRFVDKKVEEIERLLESCETEMVEIRGGRDVLINSLVTLFDELSTGDSWTTLTTPPVWQRSALGLDGRYATATVRAVLRGASVHRAYTISVEELGLTWVSKFAKELKNAKEVELRPLAEEFSKAVLSFDYQVKIGTCKQRSDEDAVLKAHQERFICLLESLAKMKQYTQVGPLMHVDDFDGIGETKGLYLGLIPVATAKIKRELHTKYPVSLMYLGKEANEHDRWLLVMTDIRGRNEYETNPAWPQLLGVKVYKSVMGYPKNRVLEMEELLRGSFCIGGIVDQLAACAGAVC